MGSISSSLIVGRLAKIFSFGYWLCVSCCAKFKIITVSLSNENSVITF